MIEYQQFEDGMEAIRSSMAHRVRKEARNLIFGNTIADLMVNDTTRQTSEVLQKINNYKADRNRYNTSKYPTYAFAEGAGKHTKLFLRNPVPMKVS